MIGIARTEDILAMNSVELIDDPTISLDATCVADLLDLRRASPRYPDILDQVAAHGIRVPVLIRTCDSEPWLLDGHHRVTAAVDLGLTHIPWTDYPLSIDHDEAGPLNPRYQEPWAGYTAA